MSLDNVDGVTPYSTITPYATGFPEWVAEEDAERIAAYNQYEWMYWSNEEAFQLARRPSDGAPIYLPTPRTIVDSTAHFLLKGLNISVKGEAEGGEFSTLLEAFLKRERFYSRFNTAKRAGVCRGDWVFHITGDPDELEGSRISLTAVDPASYFPVFDPDDLDVRIGVRLVELIADEEDETKTLVKVLEYGYQDDRVWREENLWEMEGWNNPEEAELVRTIHPLEFLDPRITQIPVYHFKNIEWGNEPFGASELRGLERVFEAINQAASDEDLALALSGLGVYATDAGRPVNENGDEVDWEVYPGVVLEVPGATMFKRVEGVSSVTPIQDHVGMLKDAAYDAAGTTDVALGNIDTNVAESGIALAIKFLPMAAKIEDRDQLGVDILTQMFYDLKFWFLVYEGWNYIDREILIELGEKLPINKSKVVEELNNMYDRNVISAAHYRREMTKLGYEFPENIQDEILEEKRLLTEAQAIQPQSAPENEQLPGPGGRKEGQGDTLPDEQQNRSNNSGRVNESDGTEVDAD